jgi:predicted glycosyltransferase
MDTSCAERALEVVRAQVQMGDRMSTDTRVVWIDLDNTPHVPFFRPIIADLRRRGHEVLVTARDAYNVTDLLKLHRMECTVVGRHFGKNKLMKVIGLGVRAGQLLPLIAKRRPHVAVSHGSRAQTLVAKVLGVPSVLIADYEHVTHLTRPDVLVIPDVMPTEGSDSLSKRIRKYPGIKEDVYASSFAPDASLKRELGLADDDIVVTFRPPATEAHYHSHQSDELSAAALDLLSRHDRTKIVLLPRNEQQKAEVVAQYPHLLKTGKMLIPERAVDGLNLVWHSDLVISGGGTMNREAAALGVPVYSTFRGPIGAVDRYLASAGRLVLLESKQDVRERILLTKRDPTSRSSTTNETALGTIVSHIVDAAAQGPKEPSRLRSGDV